MSFMVDRQEARMADGKQNDTCGSLGNEPRTLKELMSDVLAAVERLIETDGGPARAQLEQMVRERPLTSLAVAAAAGYLLASLGRR
jgi:hypothetical protein